MVDLRRFLRPVGRIHREFYRLYSTLLGLVYKIRDLPPVPVDHTVSVLPVYTFEQRIIRITWPN